MADCKAVGTPIVKDDPEEKDAKESTFSYRAAHGALMYLMTGTRPDIAYAVSIVSRTLENPTCKDAAKIKRIFCYLQGTKEMLFSTNQAVKWACLNATVMQTMVEIYRWVILLLE